MSKEDTFAFPDTNIFLHFQFFTEIPWDEVLQAKPITLMVAPVIAKELDKHKYNHPSERVKERATKVTKKFADILRSKAEVRPNVIVQFERIEPQSEFEKYHLSKESQDDHFIASILRFQSETGNKAILITNDFSLMVKAHQLNLEILELPAEYQNKSEENTDKKKIKKLENEIRELKNLSPNLKLSSKCKILSKKQTSEEEIKAEIQHIQKTFPKYDVPESTVRLKPQEDKPVIKTSTGVNISNLFPNEEKVDFTLPDGKIVKIYPQDIKNHNHKLEAFYKEYEEYLLNKLKIEDIRMRTILLKVEVSNEGTSPARDIKVNLLLPKDFQVTTDKETFSYPEKLEPPKLLATFSDILGNTRFGASTFIPNLLYPSVISPWEEVKIKQTENSPSVIFQSLKLNHGYSFHCPKTLYVTFPTSQQLDSFQVEYKITAENIPKALEGKLNIIIEK